jgi:hypothetical protein
MKGKTLSILLAFFCLAIATNAQELSLDKYLLNFDYESRTDMKNQEQSTS